MHLIRSKKSHNLGENWTKDENFENKKKKKKKQKQKENSMAKMFAQTEFNAKDYTFRLMCGLFDENFCDMRY